MSKSIFIMSNVFAHEEIKSSREINTDSPAESKKVCMMGSLLSAKSTIYILSLGRGRPRNKLDWFDSAVFRDRRVVYIYAPFSNFKVLSYLVSFFYFSYILLRYRKNENKTLIFYNRAYLYLFYLMTGYFCNYKIFVDIEDGENFSRLSIRRYTNFLFDRLCKGAILANKHLECYTRLASTFVYYGVSNLRSRDVFVNNEISFLYSGTLEKDTGFYLYIESIIILDKHYAGSKKLLFNVTGKLPSNFEVFEFKNPLITVNFLGMLDYHDYKTLLGSSDVGLSLKLNSGLYADSTFPSKTVEYVSNNLLLVSTDISDVKEIFEDCALYLEEDCPILLSEILLGITREYEACRLMSNKASKILNDKLSSQAVAPKLNSFLEEC
jgi:hypothetical protein